METILDQLHSILFYNDPSKYLPKLSEQFIHYSYNQSKEIIKYLKSTIKAKKHLPVIKLQALKVIEYLMNSKNPAVIEYCGKKLYNRFKIFAEYKKESTEDRRGTYLFNAETKMQQHASEDFLILLLRCIKSWNDAFGVDSRGRQTCYAKLYAYLKSRNVTFPNEKTRKEKEEIKQNLQKIRKNVRNMMESINCDESYEKIEKIGKSLKFSNKTIEEHIEKYMDLEDHELIKDLNQCLDLLDDGRKAYKSWKIRVSHKNRMEQPELVFPPTCLFLKDLSPRLAPEPDELNESLVYFPFDEISPGSALTERGETELEKELTTSIEWTGLGADYCKLKDKLDVTEQDINNYKLELDRVTIKYVEECENSEKLESLLQLTKETYEEIAKESQEIIYKISAENEILREQNKLFAESIRDLEEKQEKAVQDLKTKQEQIDNLLIVNGVLAANCKNLEKDSEGSISNSEATLHNGEPTKMGRIFLIPNAGEDQFEEPFQVELNKNDSEIDDPVLEKWSQGFISAREPTDRFSLIDNILFYKECMKKKKGVLYENLQIKVYIKLEVKENAGRAVIKFENKAHSDLMNFKTKLYSDSSDGISIAMNLEKTENLNKTSSLSRYLSFEISGFFQGFPLLRVTYHIENEKKQILLLLPITYTLFCMKPKIDFIKEWDSIEECRESVCKTEAESIKKLTRTMLFNKNFEHSYIEGNGVIIATLSPLGLVLAVITLKEAQLNIQVKSKDSKVRDLVSSMIETQLLSGN